MWRRCLFISLLCAVRAQFKVPDADIQILHPKGFTVSIPDEEGIRLFAFHAKINEEMNGREAGTYSRDILSPKNGRWTFADKSTRFKVGDVIYYWTYVEYFDGEITVGYPRDDQHYVVREIPKNNANKGNNGNKPQKQTETWTSSTRPPSTTSRTTTTSKPFCTESVTKVNGDRTCSQSLVFQDNFDRMDWNKWQAEIKYAREPDYEFVQYINDPETLFLKDDLLCIKPVPADEKYGPDYVSEKVQRNLGPSCTGIPDSEECVQTPAAFFILPPILSSRINTNKSFSFLYGQVDVRAKLPKGDWIYPELFLTPKRHEYGPKYDSGEIRIAFLVGNENLSNELGGGFLIGTTSKARAYGMREIKKDVGWNDDFHIFSVKWKPDGITVYVDNIVYGNISPPYGGFANALVNETLPAANKWRQGGPMAPFDKEMYITVGVGVGGQSIPDRKDGTKPYENKDPKGQKQFYKAKHAWKETWGPQSQLQVDYIKVYAL